MQREIKFRGINPINGQFVFGYYYMDKTGMHFIHSGHTIYRVLPKTLGQFTGLTDKNGVEIYENDYIDLGSYHGKGVVVYANGSYKVKGNVRNRLIGFGSFAKQVEVLNIHTNP